MKTSSGKIIQLDNNHTVYDKIEPANSINYLINNFLL